ncbi:SigE family RNA polymerase sigma factor [Jatrophihabitans endophyticus]|uniref:SigE family RNA polymerase sigma factor n=1 Tax=Jatrophihabitans endophyticus TaxID=1206085 RepID=UPI0019E9D4E6|nr:SigE family RNA polymerase sigma factor [Jatrophihabitans endophyticus]MBE7187075.1 SigE family RNA polymerase sigma factor [Jatrophihabitans endophyticus]
MTYEQYVDAYWVRLSRFAAVLTGDTALAEDVLQAVLARAWERWPQVSASTHVHAYVRRMIVNEFVSWNRRWRRIVPVDDLTDLVPAVSDSADRHATRLSLLAALSGLPSRQRAAIVLRYYESLDDAEIADALGCGESTVRSNIARGLSTLREHHGTELRTS